jgi:hypothetical protein
MGREREREREEVKRSERGRHREVGFQVLGMRTKRR